MSSDSEDNCCYDICFTSYGGDKSYKLLADVFAGSDKCDGASEEKLLERGYEKYNYYGNTRFRKEYTVCHKCFVDKYNDIFMACPVCVKVTERSHLGSTLHQESCKKCKKQICALRVYAFGSSDDIKFCGYCPKCCQGMKVICNMCGGKYNKRSCDAHTHGSRMNEYRCDQEHCRECCKTAHICMLCEGTSDERFKFDWKGTFHPGCLKKGGKLECSRCHKKFGAKSFYDGDFGKKICKKCIICSECGENFSTDMNCYTNDHLSKTDQLVCYSCLEKRRLCEKCGERNDTDRWQRYPFCQKCMMCEKCGGGCYKAGSWSGAVYTCFEQTGRLKCSDCIN